jgi:hypothetical protein
MPVRPDPEFIRDLCSGADAWQIIDTTIQDAIDAGVDVSEHLRYVMDCCDLAVVDRRAEQMRESQ